MSEQTKYIVQTAFEALAQNDLEALKAILDEDVRWSSADPAAEPDSTCWNRTEVIDTIEAWLQYGARPELTEVLVHGDRALAVLHLDGPPELVGEIGADHFHVIVVRDDRVTSIVSYPDRESAIVGLTA